MMYAILSLSVLPVLSSAAIRVDRQVEKQFWVHRLESLRSLQLVDQPADAMTEGWLAPDAFPVAKKPAIWYSDIPPETSKSPQVSDLRCTQVNATTRSCYQTYMEGYYWGKTIRLIPKVKCPRKLCSIQNYSFFNLTCYEEWYQTAGAKVNHANYDQLPYQLEPLSNGKWQVHSRFLYQGPTDLLVWLKPLYWAKSTWFSTTKYSKAKQSTQVRRVTLFQPIGKRGKLYGLLGLSNQSLENNLQFQSPFNFQIIKV